MTSNRSTTLEAPNASCLVAVVEGRGGARGEVGVAALWLDNPTLVLCQFSDSRTYVRTLAKGRAGQNSRLWSHQSTLYRDLVFANNHVLHCFDEKLGLGYHVTIYIEASF